METEYVTVGGGGDTSSCGILAYVSFASSATRSHAEAAANTLLNLPILTTGLWGDDESSTMSVLSLGAEASSSCSLVIVPQANLISKVKQNGRSIQYHGQIAKEKGEDLYIYFCDCLKGKLLEAQCLSKSQELPDWYEKRRDFEQQQYNKKQQSPSPSTPPDQLFRDETKYSEWDEKGFPLKDAKGVELTKSALKKLKKIYDAHCKKHMKWLEQCEKNGVVVGGGEEQSSESGPPPAQWDDCLDPSFCHFVAGSFGKRQGLELKSDMGPFVHTFQV